MTPTAQVQADHTPTRRMPCLVVLSGQERGRVVALKPGRSVVGRAAESDVVLDEKGISRRHVALELKSGKVRFMDLGSTNGCWQNGRQVARAQLNDGDCLQLGSCRLAFRLNLPDEERLLKRLYFRATRDALTGLHNRASLLDRLSREVLHQTRYRRGLALIQLDLDHFKRLNDRFGHQGGDQALAAVGKTLQDSLRGSDLAGRAGGEEFVVILPETSEAQARLIASKIRQRISALRLSHGGQRLRITASLGVAAAGKKSVRAQALLKAADEACYRAKHKGRNQVA